MTTPTAGKEISNPFEKFERLTSTPKTILKDQPIVETPQTKTEDKVVTSPAKDAKVAQTPVTPSVKEEVKSPEPRLDGTTDNTVTPAPKPEIKEPVNGSSNSKEKEKTVTKEATKPTITTAAPQATLKPIATSSTGKLEVKPTKSPTTTKPPKSPALRPQPNLIATKQTPERKVSNAEKTPKAATPAAKPSGPSSVKKPPPLHASPAAAGFVKPKVKSPTRPLKLPPGLTTHTAASGSKVKGDSAHPASSLARSSSRASMSGTGTSSKAAPAKTLKRQTSTIGRSRPSIGPPPPQPAKDHHPKHQKPVDESFLARMMRPTQASASKVTEKVPISPPRHGPAASRKTSPASKPRIKKAASRTGGTPATSRPHSSTSGNSAPSTSHTQLAPAAEIVAAAKPAEDDTKPGALDVVAETTAVQEVAAIAEQAETAEEAVEAAKEAEGEISLPETSPGIEALTNSLEHVSVKSKDAKAEVNGHTSSTPQAEETETPAIVNKDGDSEVAAPAA
ncbi:hypothetical protein B0T21DRAFT_406846 [Apiosordaria backusii]|uniref:Uncharacterized protein n=1 Tax=Apiosordaria backusii TaxID=314023 RepID=A0AA40K6Y6_9PEZI|nr:hypothetical protein B0T21DRAFT_406846 [Apiosordaria backusii]